MPSRIIKESITTSESLSEVSADAERLFWRLVVKADDFGLYYGNPRILASMCFPLDPPKEQKIRAWLSELVAAGMVGTYTASEDGKHSSVSSNRARKPTWTAAGKGRSRSKSCTS